jgi:beta-glucosidase
VSDLKFQGREQQGMAKRVLPPFPKNFIWGASTAAYQIEGAANEDGRGASIWDVFSQSPGKVKTGETGDVACDHYHRYKEDIALMRDLGLSVYRFSVSWPRVLPLGEGAPNEKGLDFYGRLIDGLLESGVEPWLCLYHWDLPQALHLRGGWTDRRAADWFGAYAELLARRFGGRVARWVTFNEPNVFTIAGYATGVHAPGVADIGAMFAAAHNVNRAHGRAVDAIRTFARTPIGVVCNQQPVRPHRPGTDDEASAAFADLVWNRMFADPMILGAYPEGLAPVFAPLTQEGDLAGIRRPLDFFGLNHYSPVYVKSDPAAPGGLALADAPEGAPRTMMGWEIAPDAFRETLVKEHKRYGLPIVVTENGVAFRDVVGPDGRISDEGRIDYLADYLGAVADAIKDGARIDGYCVWSLLDNFEWAEGYTPRFGIVHVDYATQKRTPKASFRWLKSVIARVA